jgi:hypothetical protein
MKLLFDQNLSFKLCERLADVFPGSEHQSAVKVGVSYQIKKARGK